MADARPTGGIDRVLVAGATGKTGRRVVQQLADAPVTVRGLTRSPDARDWLRERGADEVVVGDLLRRGAADRAVADVDAVITCVGSTPRELLGGRVLVDGRGNENLLAAARDAEVGVFVMQSSLGVDGDRGSWMARFFRATIAPAIRAKTRAERAIKATDLRYAIVRPGLLVSAGTAGRVAPAGTGLWGVASRDAVARVLAAAAFTPRAWFRTFEMASNPLQRDAGLGLDWREPWVPA